MQAATEQPTEYERRKAVRKLNINDLQEAQYAYGRFSVTIDPEWSLADVLKPEFWSNVSHRFAFDKVTQTSSQRGAIIDVRKEDNSLYAELYVVDADKTSLTVELLRKYEFGKKLNTVESTQYESRWNAGKKAYQVIRNSDREVVEQFKSKADALDWIVKQDGN